MIIKKKKKKKSLKRLSLTAKNSQPNRHENWHMEIMKMKKCFEA